MFCIFYIYRDQYAFYNFVNAISANGGGDSAEDIMGGLHAAFSKLSWGDEEVVKVRMYRGVCKIIILLPMCPHNNIIIIITSLRTT